MKKILLLLLFILIGCSKEPINMDEMLIERDQVYYTKDTNQPYSGPVFSLHENGQLQAEGTLKDGTLDGFGRGYYKNGQLQAEVSMKDNKLDGSFKLYHENGQLSIEATFKDGKEDGVSKVYDENGQVLSEALYKDGELVE